MRAPALAGKWLSNTNHSPGVIAFVRRARRLLPGDPDFGDPLSTAGRRRAARRRTRRRPAAARP